MRLMERADAPVIFLWRDRHHDHKLTPTANTTINAQGIRNCNGAASLDTKTTISAFRILIDIDIGTSSTAVAICAARIRR